VDYIGREALENIAKIGPDRKIYGVLFDTPSCPTCSKPWLIKRDDVELGQITSGIYSPRLGKNIGVGLIKKGFWTAGLEVSVILPDGQIRRGHLSNLPFA
jgi:dimethylsulfoniopropionate demethylase